jgi:Zinc knuckle
MSNSTTVIVEASSVPKCFRCGVRGHISTNCPRLTERALRDLLAAEKAAHEKTKEALVVREGLALFLLEKVLE